MYGVEEKGIPRFGGETSAKGTTWKKYAHEDNIKIDPK
jgi:hypothetical protein